MSRAKVVALGGGHGLHAMLTALRMLPVDITAIVTVADDGGSSGRLRRDIDGLLPPGDLRMALAALAADNEEGALWAKTFQHRFAGEGALAGHPVGNLVLAGLAEVTGDPIVALNTAAAMLGCVGRVLPMACRPLDIIGEVAGLADDPDRISTIRGQVAVAATPGRVLRVRLEPPDAPACSAAISAIIDADLVVLGPGSWFTSVLPHVLVPELRAALLRTSAHRLVVLNLVPQPGETEGFSPEQHLVVLSSHVPEFRADTVLADRVAVSAPGRLAEAAQQLGAVVHLAAVGDPSGAPRHQPQALADALTTVLDRHLDQRTKHHNGEQANPPLLVGQEAP